MPKKFKTISVALFTVYSALFAKIALAQPDLGTQYGEYTGLGGRDLRIIIADIINIALGFLGVAAVVVVLWGGYQYLTSQGNRENTEKAQKTIFGGVIGIAIILSAFILARFILGSLITATTGVQN